MQISGDTIFYIGYDVNEFLPEYMDDIEEIHSKLIEATDDWKNEHHDYIKHTVHEDNYAFYIGFTPDFTKLKQESDGSFGMVKADVYDFIKYIGDDEEIEHVKDAFRYVFNDEPPVNPNPNIIVELSIIEESEQ